VRFFITGLLNIWNCYWSLIEDYNTDNINHFNIDGGIFLCNKMIINGNKKKNINFIVHSSKSKERFSNVLSNAGSENMVLI
jgi:hypothetical protein